MLGLLVSVLFAFAGQGAVAAGVTLDPEASARAVDSRLVGKPPAAPPTEIFAINDFDHGLQFPRNPMLWCADLAPYLTCFSPWNSNEHQYQGGTLITPKHALFAEHFSGRSGSNTLHGGDKLLFVGSSNVLYRRTLKDTPARVPGTDICVGTFTENDLPPDVIPAPVLPAGLKDSAFPAGTPVIFCDKDKQAKVGELVSLNGVTIRPATGPLRAPFTKGGPAIIGDSGSPIFLVVDGRLALLALFFAPNGGPSVSANIEGINSLLGRGYALDVLKIDARP